MKPTTPAPSPGPESAAELLRSLSRAVAELVERIGPRVLHVRAIATARRAWPAARPS